MAMRSLAAEALLTCPICGAVGSETNEIVAPGAFNAPLVTGLDLKNCGGCRVTLERAGYEPFSMNVHPWGLTIVPIREADLPARPDDAPSLIPRGLNLGGV
jgi:hypothetical protein